MEKTDEILEILNNWDGQCLDLFAREIAALYECYYPAEFVEWLIKNDHPFIYMGSINKWKRGDILVTKKKFTLHELYQYWKDNIKDKEK